jgi:hypothetical protein
MPLVAVDSALIDQALTTSVSGDQEQRSSFSDEQEEVNQTVSEILSMLSKSSEGRNSSTVFGQSECQYKLY